MDHPRSRSSRTCRTAACVVLCCVGALLAGCAAPQAAPRAHARTSSTGKAAVGQASYYADMFNGRPTASGERFDNGRLTAAHRTLAFGTKVRVTNLANGRSVVVRVNDRGPFVKGRIIDLSQAAAKRIDMIRAGVVRVKVETISPPARRAVAAAK